MNYLIAGCGGIALAALVVCAHVYNRRHDRKLTPEQRKDWKEQMRRFNEEW